MTDRSIMFFPLRSNAAALTAGPGVAAVRRRILVAGLLHDQVVLEPGLHVAWAGATGGSQFTAHGEQPTTWQSLRARGKATGARHWFAVRPTDAPPDAPLTPLVQAAADFSWKATYEPFRAELPASAASWLEFAGPADEQPIKQLVNAWKRTDRLVDAQQYVARGGAPAPAPPGGQFVHDALIDAGYFDLATAAVAGSAVSIDRRHMIAIEQRLRAREAQRIAGHYALELLLPTDFTWDDVAELREMPALREYRTVMGEVEELALQSATSVEEVEERIRSEYRERLARAQANSIPFRGRVLLAAVGLIAGGIAAPAVGAAAGAAGFAVSEAWNWALKPRWLSVHRRAAGRPPEGI